MITPQSPSSVITRLRLGHSMEAVNEMKRGPDQEMSAGMEPGEEVSIDGVINRPGRKSHRTISRNFQKESEVKNHIIATAIITTLAAIGILVVGCGPQPRAPENQSGRGTHTSVDRPGPTAGEDILGNAERAAYMVIGNQIMQGLATGADLAAALQQIDETRQALQQLDEAARAVHVVIGNQIMQGLADGSDLAEALQPLEQERQNILAGIGLAP